MAATAAAAAPLFSTVAMPCIDQDDDSIVYLKAIMCTYMPASFDFN